MQIAPAAFGESVDGHLLVPTTLPGIIFVCRRNKPLSRLLRNMPAHRTAGRLLLWVEEGRPALAMSEVGE